MPSDDNDLGNAVRTCYAAWSGRYYQDYYSSADAYPPIHTAIVRGLLRKEDATSVLDAGCGPASMLRDLDLPNLARFGFDLTPAMVEEARRVLGDQGVPATNVWEGSVLDPAAFRRSVDVPADGFDATICFGVLPHVPEEADVTVLNHLRDAVRPGGLVAVEARNALFALFTLNRYSRAFFRDTLICEGAIVESASTDERAAVQAALAELDARFRMDIPPLRGGYEGEPGYDEVLSRTHVPMELEAKAQAAGIADTRILFYHFHALPPMLEPHAPALFRRQSLAMEDPGDWRGYIMASAFILVGRRPK